MNSTDDAREENVIWIKNAKQNNIKKALRLVSTGIVQHFLELASTYSYPEYIILSGLKSYFSKGILTDIWVLFRRKLVLTDLRISSMVSTDIGSLQSARRRLVELVKLELVEQKTKDTQTVVWFSISLSLS